MKTLARGPLGQGVALYMACLMTLSCDSARRSFGASVNALAGTAAPPALPRRTPIGM